MMDKQWLELIDENRKEILQVMQEAQIEASMRGECGYKELVILHDDGWVEEYMATGHECFDLVRVSREQRISYLKREHWLGIHRSSDIRI